MAPRLLDDIDLADYPATTRACPRCQREVEQRFGGPCSTCLAELRTSLAARPRDVADAEYVPKMNVTPNAVALKEDD